MKLTTDPGYRLTYVVNHEAWYAHVDRGEYIMVQKSADAGGAAWEFSIRQISNIGIRVEIFNDAFSAFSEIPEFFAALDLTGVTDLSDVRELLDTLGFTDTTARTRPDAGPPADALTAGDTIGELCNRLPAGRTVRLNAYGLTVTRWEDD